jgi:hypothetical protein
MVLPLPKATPLPDCWLETRSTFYSISIDVFFIRKQFSGGEEKRGEERRGEERRRGRVDEISSDIQSMLKEIE